MYSLPDKEEFLQQIKENIYSPNIPLIEMAWDLAYSAHGNQFRVSGISYFEHPVSVAKILLEINCDSETIAAALLHDVVEDTPTTINEIQEKFGDSVANLVEAVTKVPALSSIFDKNLAKADSKKKTIQKLFDAIAIDVRVALIKLADRIHNLHTLGAIKNKEKRKEKASDTLKIYVPLAELLGLDAYKNKIQDLAFKFYEPEIYDQISNSIEKKEKEYEKYIEDLIDIIEMNIEKNNIKNSIVYGRRKEVYSIYKKMLTLDLEVNELNQVYDLIGIRIIVKSESDCYAILSAINDIGEEINYNDYISKPRDPFNYQSLHKIIYLHPVGKVEIQIRTEKMHEVAEKGTASHWKYKMRESINPETESTLRKLRENLDNLNNHFKSLDVDNSDSEEFISEVNNSALKNQNYIVVKTPKGNSIYLRNGATTIDFAYHIHSNLGDRIYSARVNRIQVPIGTKLKNLDEVEIITKPDCEPKYEWIRENKVVTSKAIERIKSYLRKEKTKESIKEGQDFFEKSLLICSPYKISKEKVIRELKALYKREKIEELYLEFFQKPNLFERRLGQIALENYFIDEKIDYQEWIDKLVLSCYKKKLIQTNTKTELFNSILNESLSERQISKIISSSEFFEVDFDKYNNYANSPKQLPLEIQNAKCCTPIPPDEIIAFVSYRKKLIIHKKDCSNILKDSINKSQLIETNWDDKEIFGDKILITTTNLTIRLRNEKTSTYESITKAIKKTGTTLKSLIPLAAKNRVNYNIIIQIEIFVKNRKEEDLVIKTLNKLDSVLSIYKTNY